MIALIVVAQRPSHKRDEATSWCTHVRGRACVLDQQDVAGHTIRDSSKDSGMDILPWSAANYQDCSELSRMPLTIISISLALEGRASGWPTNH